MRELTTAYIGLGSNLGDREAYIKAALDVLAANEQTGIGRVSSLVESEALGDAKQPKYLNAVAEVKTRLNAHELHGRLMDIEAKFGRTRKEKWAARTIDLDLLLFGEEVINSDGLAVPHPQMHLRSFVLRGLCQLNGKLQHPVLKEPVDELANRLGGGDFVSEPSFAQLVAIAGIIGVGKTTLAKKLSERLGGKLLLEPYDENPFLPQVYAGKNEMALDSQLYFLTHRAKQLNRGILTQGKIAISDYIFDKELIYAKRLLNAEQLALYEKIHQPLAEQIASPVVVIYLMAPAEQCLERIRRRNRPYEQQIKLEFLEALNRDYKQLFAGWKRCPVIRKQMAESNYTPEGDIDHLVNQIRNYVAIQ